MILGNVRVPDQVLGDLHAQVTANRVCALGACRSFSTTQRMVDLSGAVGDPARARRSGHAPRHRSRARRRQYHSGQLTPTASTKTRPTSNARSPSPAVLRRCIDYAGTSAQIERGLNCVMNYTHAYSAYPLKCALDPDTPRNEGSYRPITVTGPRRAASSTRSTRRPATRVSSPATCLPGSSTRRSRKRCPIEVIADCGGAPTMRAVFSGGDGRGRRFSQILCSPAAVWAPQRAR